MESIKLGVIGFGSFAMFAVQEYMQIPSIKLSGLSGTHREEAIRAAERFGLKGVEDISKMLSRKDIDIVYIATPPFLHYENAAEALKAGKHVIVEKPFALNLEQADEMINLSKEKGLVVTANLIQRYNPLYDKIKKLINLRVLGELLHCFFENYASDENLHPEHWFWDKKKSGGIFVEHGVHFFDLFEGLLGKGKMESAQATLRPGTQIEDQVQCSVRYGDVIANFYHGFTQATRMDRQEIRLIFEKGDVSIYDWIPSWLRIHAISSEKEMKTLCELFPHSQIEVVRLYSGREREVISRHKQYQVYQKYNLTYREGLKMNLYGQVVRGLMEDQLKWISNKTHKRKVTELNGRASLETALEAGKLAHQKLLI
ncbi:MAG: Gfo/Idh/MocA family protein [Ignavibacteria bacterium]